VIHLDQPIKIKIRPLEVKLKGSEASIWQTFKDIITALSPLVTVIIAWMALTTWQRQLRGTADHEAARRVLAEVYRVVAAFREARSDFMSLAEMNAALSREAHKKILNEIPQFEIAQEAYAFQRRKTKVLKALESLFAASVEAKVLWGNEIQRRVDAFDEYYVAWATKIDVYLGDRATPNQGGKSREERAEAKNAVFGGRRATPLTTRINELAADIEEFLRPRIVGNRAWWLRLRR